MKPNSLNPKHEGWDAYWSPDVQGAHRLYAMLASAYRRIFICSRLAHWLCRYFSAGSSLLHAGCGGGEVDALISKRFRITALDISPNALQLYRRNNPNVADTVHADLLHLNLRGRNFDGAYNLGVMEHFGVEEIARILQNMMSVVKPGGRLVIFWPFANALSVKLLGAWHGILNRRAGAKVVLHPPEINLIHTKRQVQAIVNRSGLVLEKYSVSPLDLFIQAVLVVRRP